MSVLPIIQDKTSAEAAFEHERFSGANESLNGNIILLCRRYGWFHHLLPFLTSFHEG